MQFHALLGCLLEMNKLLLTCSFWRSHDESARYVVIHHFLCAERIQLPALIYVGPYVVKIHDSFVRMFFSAAELNEGRPAHGSLPLRDEWSLYVVDRQVWNGKKQYWSSHRYNFSYYIIWAIYVEDFHSTPTFLILQGLRCAINMQV